MGAWGPPGDPGGLGPPGDPGGPGQRQGPTCPGFGQVGPHGHGHGFIVTGPRSRAVEPSGLSRYSRRFASSSAVTASQSARATTSDHGDVDNALHRLRSSGHTPLSMTSTIRMGFTCSFIDAHAFLSDSPRPGGNLGDSLAQCRQCVDDLTVWLPVPADLTSASNAAR